MMMSSNVRSPVEVQVPVNIPDGVGDNHIFKRELGLRRIFVQTDAGNVLDIELHRADKVQFIKKTVQALLHMPTEQSALLFGDHVLEDDLREVRSDSPLLLTRELHRSSSTPCLSPTYDVEKHKNAAQPFETVGRSKCCPKIKKIMRESVKALEAGVQPVLAGGGLGGAYYFRNRHGMNIAIVKPTDEEPLAPNNPKGFVGKALGQPGLNRSIRVGETGVREVAAYLLDHDHFAKVPATALVKATHKIFNVNKVEFMGVSSQENSAVAKIGSFQQFVDHDYDASDCGTSHFPVSAVHRIGILDVRIFNTDRHAGNILVKKERERDTYDYHSSHSSLRLEGRVELIPIDHGLCLPETLEDPYFEWLHWPQASFPFLEEELEYIRSLDPYKDADMLRKELPMLREACLRMLVLSTTFLQKAVEAGLCLSEIGAMMSREVCGVGYAVSELEVVCMLAKAQVEQEISTFFWDADEINLGSPLEEEYSADQFQFDMDQEELSWIRLYSPRLLMFPEAKAQPCRSPQSPCAVVPVGSTDSPRHHSPCSPSALACPRGSIRALSVLQELQPVEEEEGLVMGGKFFPASPPSPCYSTSAAISRPFLSRCSASFNSRTHQFPNHFEPRKRNVNKNFASQVTQTGNSAQGPSMTPVVISEMNGKAWMLFMDHFEILVQEAFARRKCESAGRLQRLGKSCQF